MNWGEILEQLQAMAEKQKGKDIRDMCATQLIDKEISELPCISSPLSIHDNYLWYDTQLFSEIPIAKFQAQYDEDRRCIDGLSYKIREIEIILFQNPPREMEIRQMNRWLQYAVAQERREQILDHITELERCIISEKARSEELLSVMEQNRI